MAHDGHPHSEHRDHKVQRRRVAHITRGYAHGGAVQHSDETSDKKLIKKMLHEHDLSVEGKKARHRLDRAKGGRAGKGKTTVNVIVAGQHPGAGGPPAPVPLPPPRPPIAAGPPPGAGLPPGAMPPRPMPPPGALPPGMPPRASGGSAYAKGGAVKSGPTWNAGRRAGTQVQNSPGKDDSPDIGRGKVITYKTGGAVEAKGASKATFKKGSDFSEHGPMGPHFHGGGHGGLARLEKASRARGRT